MIDNDLLSADITTSETDGIVSVADSEGKLGKNS